MNRSPLFRQLGSGDKLLSLSQALQGDTLAFSEHSKA